MLVLEVYDKEYWPPDKNGHIKLLYWLSQHNISARGVWKLEVHIIDCMFLRVFEFDRNEGGELYLAADGYVAEKKPYDVLINELPPVKFREV